MKSVLFILVVITLSSCAFEEGDLTAIDELLKFIPNRYLKGYLPEE